MHNVKQNIDGCDKIIIIKIAIIVLVVTNLSELNPLTTTDDVSRPNTMNGRVHSVL